MITAIISELFIIALERTALFVAIAFVVRLLKAIVPRDKINNYLSGRKMIHEIDSGLLESFFVCMRNNQRT
ncbi:MAG: hypothetical protein ACI35R_15380 [Bacillus sp. (in: firmicutes)]